MAKRAEDVALDDALRVGEIKAETARKELEEYKTRTAEREQLLARYHQAIGQVKTANVFAEFAQVSALVWIQQMRDSKLYKEFGTWESFCESIGYSRHKIEEDLKNLAAFGEQFIANVSALGIGYRDLRKLRQLTHDGALVIEGNSLVIEGEVIPLDADHEEDIKAAIEKIIETSTSIKEEAEANLAAKDRVLAAKEDVIKKQEKELGKLSREAAKKGLTPEEDAFLQRMENARTIHDGFLMEFDPERNPLPEDATPRMRAAYMETIGYLKRGLDAAYDTAADYYGEAGLDGSGWVQPNLRKENDN